MGCGAITELEQKNTINVATLNYSGITLSPFQYYSEDFFDCEMQMNSIFRKIKHLQKEEGNEWIQYLDKQSKLIHLLDKYTKHKRYSPLYQKFCGIKDRKFMNKAEFYSQWEDKFLNLVEFSPYEIQTMNQSIKKYSSNENSQNLSIFKDPFKGSDMSEGKKRKAMSMIEQMIKTQTRYETPLKKLDSEAYAQIKGFQSENYEKYERAKECLKLFDFICYRTIVAFVYKVYSLQKLKSERSVLQYCEFYDHFCGTKRINQEKKIGYLKKFLQKNKIDVMFIQEGTKQLRKSLEKDTKYRIILQDKSRANDKNQGTMLLINEASFLKANIGRKGNKKFLQIQKDKHLDEKMKSELFSFGNNVGFSIDNFLFISVDFPHPSPQYYQKKNKRDPICKKKLSKMHETLRLLKKYFPKKYIVLGGCFHQEIPHAIFQKYSQKAQKKVEINLEHPFRIFPTDLEEKQYQQHNKTIPKIAENFVHEMTHFNESSSCFKRIFTTRPKLTQMQLSSINSQEFSNYKGVEDYLIFDHLLEITPSNPGKVSTGIFPIQQIDLHKKKSRRRRNQKIQNTSNFYTPNHNHPFDHLAVVATLKIPQKISVPEENKLNIFNQQEIENLQSSSNQDFGDENNFFEDKKEKIYKKNLEVPLIVNFSFFYDVKTDDYEQDS